MAAPRASRAIAIWAIVSKDLRSIAHDRFWVFMTVLAGGWLVAIFYLIPAEVDETITIGVHQSGMDKVFDETLEEEEGVEWVQYESTEELEAALGIGGASPTDTRSWLEILLGRGEDAPEAPTVGIEFPDDFLAAVMAGKETTVTVYVDTDVPQELRGALTSIVREAAFTLSGNALPVTQPDEETVVLGVDRVGNQLSYRDRLLPLVAFLVLLMETLALGTLIASEVSTKTVAAILVTPTRTADFLAAKAITGTTFAFVEVMVLMSLVGAFGNESLLLVTSLLLGSVLVAGVALVIGAAGKDFIETIFLGMLALIPMSIPAVAALFPGSASTWVKLLPTYGLVETIMGVTAFDEGWSEALPDLTTLASWCAAILVAGVFVLKRKVESL